MDAFRSGRWIELLTSPQVVIGVVWAGLAALSITLLVLTRTRWGQSRALGKCMALSLLAHLLLVSYATTVKIVASVPPPPEEPVIQISMDDEELFHSEPEIEHAPLPEKPWESFAEQSAELPTSTDPARAELDETPMPKRQSVAEPSGLNGEFVPDQFELAKAVEPEPETIPIPIDADIDDVDVHATPDRPSEPLLAPVAQRNQAPPTKDLAGPDLQRRRDSDHIPEIQPERKIVGGTPSALLGQPQPIPQLRDMPSTHEPRDSLADMADSLAASSHGKPTEKPFQQDRAEGTWLPAAQTPSAARPPSEHLRPPSPSRNRMISRPRDPLDFGPPLLPTPRRGGGFHQLPNPYRLRVVPDRSRLAQQVGATPETEEAVKAALKWLSDNQEPDGHWSAQRHGAGREMLVAERDRQSAGIRADTGMTGLALLACLAAGNTHERGEHRTTVARGLQYLVNQQAVDGGLGGQASTYAYMYCHAMATCAISEAYGMTGDPSLRMPVRRAVAHTLKAQNQNSGGWRYFPGDPGDTSQLGWQLMALKSADLAGIPMPEVTKRGAIRFLQSVSSGAHGGLAAYRPSERISRSMTAEALACRQFIGGSLDYAAAQEAGDYLMQELPGQQPKSNLYYWYYGTLSMYQLQGPYWARWNAALQRTLLRTQRKNGRLEGSWDPDTVWGGYGGRVYSTSMATLCLEVYYRFLPLYVEVASTPPMRR